MSNKKSDAKTIEEEWAEILGAPGAVRKSEAPASEKVESKPEASVFSEIENESEVKLEDSCLDVILDIPVTVSLEVGNSKISIRELLKLNQGSVVELDRLAGEPLDVLVNGTLIAHAEVVVINDKYGIRLTDVISAAERIQKLK